MNTIRRILRSAWRWFMALPPKGKLAVVSVVALVGIIGSLTSDPATTPTSPAQQTSPTAPESPSTLGGTSTQDPDDTAGPVAGAAEQSDAGLCREWYAWVLMPATINLSDADHAVGLREFANRAQTDALRDALLDEAHLWDIHDEFVDSDVPDVCGDLGVTGP